MSESKNTASQLEYIEVTIGKVKMRTTKESADRLIEQMAKQPEYQQQFYNPVEFVAPVDREAVAGLDNL